MLSENSILRSSPTLNDVKRKMQGEIALFTKKNGGREIVQFLSRSHFRKFYLYSCFDHADPLTFFFFVSQIV
jgi:hypothetical protein